MNIRPWIIQDEGFKNFPYTDTCGKLTIGVGRNLTDRGLSNDEVNFLFENDLRQTLLELNKHDWFTKQPAGVRDALTNMCFNLGITKLLRFNGMIDCLEKKDYEGAAHEAIASLWANQVGHRSAEIADAIRQGK